MEASPLHHIRPGLPPTVIFHGKADTTVPYADVERFCMASTKMGNQCQLFGYEGATHGFFNPSRAGGKWHRETLLEMDRFLTALGYLPTPSTRREY
jgi:acetyl esterase/lipase